MRAEDKKEIRIYPNPSQDELIINTKYQETNITIFNAQGRFLKSIIVRENRIPINDLSSGTYILKVHGSDDIFRFMKK